jgi:hypothetical protein
MGGAPHQPQLPTRAVRLRGGLEEAEPLRRQRLARMRAEAEGRLFEPRKNGGHQKPGRHAYQGLQASRPRARGGTGENQSRHADFDRRATGRHPSPAPLGASYSASGPDPCPAVGQAPDRAPVGTQASGPAHDPHGPAAQQPCHLGLDLRWPAEPART